MTDEKKRFMIVDEDSNFALFWEVAITEAFPNSETKICRTGYEALDEVKNEKYDFFISAWEMEAMSGLIFMQKLRQIFKYRRAPFLIFSKELTDSQLGLAREFGIDNYLLKPFDKDRVKEKVTSMMLAESSLDNTQRTLRKVEDWIAENKISEALKVIGDLLKPGPNAARAYTLCGDMWARTEHLDKAEKAYLDAIKYDPNYNQAHQGLAKLLIKLRRFSEATKQLEALNAKCPGSLDRMINLGNAYLGAGDDKKAEAAFKTVSEQDGNNTDAKQGIGKVEFHRGNMEVAARFFKESGKGDELATYFNSLGIAMVNQGKFEDAIKLYQNAVGVLPDRNRVHLLEFNIGLAYRKNEHFGQATNAFARAVIANAEYEKAYQGMALCMREAQTRKQSYEKDLVQKAALAFKEAHTNAESPSKAEAKAPTA
jgi:tetratricopeptide (TPR) repeat protein